MHFCSIIATLAFIFLEKSDAKIITTDNDLNFSEDKGVECEGGKLLSSSVCVPKHYQKADIPNEQTVVNTSLVIKNIRATNDKEMTITADIIFSLYWVDNRLKTRFSNKEKTQGRAVLEYENVKEIWLPDIYIYNLSDFNFLEVESKLGGLSLLSNFYWEQFNPNTSLDDTWIEYWFEAKVSIYCNFYYYRYPLDEQFCQFRMGSSNFGKNIIYKKMEGLLMFPTHGENALSDFDMAISFFDSSELLEDETKHGYFDNLKEIGFNVSLKRVPQPYLLKYYLPCIAIVTVTQISFYIPPDAIPGRIALLVTQFLTLTNLFISEQAESPTSRHMTALGIFLLSSLFFVLIGMAEFAILLFLLRRSEHSLSSQKSLQCSNNTTHINSTLDYVEDRRSATGHVNSSNHSRRSSTFIFYSTKIDFYATILFPILYGMFNLCYWVMYMN